MVLLDEFVELHGLAERFVVFRFGADVGLGQRLHGLLHQADADPFAVLLADDRTVMAEVDGELLLGHAGAAVLYGTVISFELIGRSSLPYL